MRAPEAPFLELNFYFADMSESAAMRHLVEELVRLGAGFTGIAKAHRGSQIGHEQFASFTDHLLEPVPVRDMIELTRSLADPDLRLVQVLMENASGAVKDVAEIVTFLSIPLPVVAKCRHPLAIWTDGKWFSGTLREQFVEQASAVGRLAYERFRTVNRALQPSYSAITSEYVLQCPAALHLDPRSHAFENFFVNGNYVGEAILSSILDQCKAAYHETIGDGLYVSCTREFNPDGMELDQADAFKLSSQVARLIATLA